MPIVKYCIKDRITLLEAQQVRRAAMTSSAEQILKIGVLILIVSNMNDTEVMISFVNRMPWSNIVHVITM